MLDIVEIRKAVSEGRIYYSVHAQRRMAERGIQTEDVENCIFTGKIIEDYSDNKENMSEKSFPSCLISGESLKKIPVHVVVGFRGNVLVITAYYPDDTWNETKERRL